jgi:hypothetical protein
VSQVQVPVSRRMQTQESARKATEDKLELQHEEAIAAHKTGKLLAAEAKNVKESQDHARVVARLAQKVENTASALKKFKEKQ